MVCCSGLVELLHVMHVGTNDEVNSAVYVLDSYMLVRAAWELPPNFIVLLIGSCVGYTGVHTPAQSVCAKAVF